MSRAPLHNELAEGPDSGHAVWLKTQDGVRIRVAVWPEGTKGTVILLPGRTEYVEKYGRTAGELGSRGYATLVIDWRGQGLADRLIDDPLVGHISDFEHYQFDLAESLRFARAQGLPEPYFMIGHSMGGAIGLRGLHEFGDEFSAAVFSGPMWGISIAPALRPLAHTLPSLAALVGLDHLRVPGTASELYVQNEPFEDNMLTTDPDMWRYMQRHAENIRGIDIIGPSLRWLREAIEETRHLHRLGPAPHETVTFIGGNERIVDTGPVRAIMRRWPNGRLVVSEGSEHEIMMETPERRNAFFDEADALFSRR